MKPFYLLLLFTYFTVFTFSQYDKCFEFDNGTYEDDLPKPLCPQCGTGKIETDAFKGTYTTYKGECKDGVLDGKWIIQSDDYFKNILTNQSGTFTKGVRTGKWITNKYHGGSFMHGPHSTHYGRLEVFYKDGVLDGPCKIYDVMHLKLVGQFKNGHRYGKWDLYDAIETTDDEADITDTSKTPVHIIGYTEYELQNEEELTKESTYLYNSKDKTDVTLLKTAFYKGLKLHGALTEFYSSGLISKVEMYKNGELNGRSYSLHPNGDTINIVDHKNDLEFGLKRTFDENGKLIKQTNLLENPKNKYRKIKHGQFLESDISEINYNMNKKSGLYWGKTIKNDTLFLDTAYYKDDLLNGKWTTYYYDSVTSSFNKSIERMCKDNKLHGELKLYENNQLIKTEAYIENQQEGDICKYNSNGLKSYCVYTSKGVKNGEYQKFNEGNLIEKGNYFNNLKEGYWFEYENNSVKTITKYKNDLTVEYYTKKGKIKKKMKELSLE